MTIKNFVLWERNFQLFETLFSMSCKNYFFIGQSFFLHGFHASLAILAGRNVG